MWAAPVLELYAPEPVLHLPAKAVGGLDVLEHDVAPATSAASVKCLHVHTSSKYSTHYAPTRLTAQSKTEHP